MSRIISISAAAILVFCTVPARANLITNGTFTSNAAGWTLGGGGCVTSQFDGGFGNPAGSVMLNACGEAGSDPTLAQTISGLTAGVTYLVSWDVHLHVNIGGGTGKSFGLFLDSEPNSPFFLGEWLDNNWHTVSATFVATGSSNTIIFAAELDGRTPNGPGVATDVSYWVDNVSVNAQSAGVPEPGVAWLVGGGLSLLLFRLRRG